MKTFDRAKKALEFLAGIIYLTSVLSCDTYGTEDIHPDIRKTPVRINVNMPVGCSSKSAFTGPVDKLSDINIYVYSDGILEESIYTRNTDDITLYLFPGKEYLFYAIANVGEITPPETEIGLQEYRYNIGSMAETNAAGLPMASIPQKTSVLYSTQDPIVIDLVRLVAKYTFVVDKNMLQHSSIEITSARIRQSALDILPFADESAATETKDWDYATQSDISMLNAGGSIEFYIPENCQGILLPDNEDQWSKVPENIPEKKDVCTYLEVGAKYTSLGVESNNIVYRMYLGEDSTTDFNIRRNSQNIVTLKITDDGIYNASWMVDKGDLTDSRSLIFNTPDIEIVKGDSRKAVSVISEPKGIQYRIETHNFEPADLHILQYKNSIHLWSDQNSKGTHEAQIDLYSWDGRLHNVCKINVVDNIGYVCFESATGKTVLRNAPHGNEITIKEFMKCTDYRICYNYLGGTNICNYSYTKSSNTVFFTLNTDDADYFDLGNAAFMNGSPVTIVRVNTTDAMMKVVLSDNNRYTGTAKENPKRGQDKWELTDSRSQLGQQAETWKMTAIKSSQSSGLGIVKAKNSADSNAYVFKWYIKEDNNKGTLELVIHLGNPDYLDESNSGAFLWNSFNDKQYGIKVLTYNLKALSNNPYVTTITNMTPTDEDSFYHIPRS